MPTRLSVPFRGELEASLIAAVMSVLGMERHQVSDGEDLSAYGFDSITLTQLANHLNKTFAFVDLEPSTFLEYTTLRELGDYLARHYQAEFEAHFQPHTAPAPVLAAAPRRGPEPPISGPTQPAPVLFQPAPERAHQPAEPAPILGSQLLESFDDELFAREQPQQPAARRATPEIAIIGLAGRFPGAQNILELWDNLLQEKNCISEVPRDRWDWKAIYGDPEAGGNLTDCRHGGFLANLDRFEPLFFDISPREASQMDPQQKIMLETVWETLEHAGYAADSLRGENIGVYLGVQRNENLFQLMADGCDFGPYTNIGNTHSMLANRISFFFDWIGNSLTVDTACASSSTALHMAFHALLRGEIRQALVGGVTVVQDPYSHIANRKMRLLTNENCVRSFDQNSSGYLIGEGVAAALLKPLDQAERDGDFLYGVIKACAVNQSGKTVFLTAPEPKSHIKVIQAALAEARLAPGAIDYIEGQGIATDLSDKAELKAYGDVFALAENGQPRQFGQKLLIGSIKGNIGHVESASGITSLIKVCLAMKTATLPAVLHFQNLNWNQSVQDLPFSVVARRQPWPQRVDANGRKLPRRAGVHNFGYGGSNVHFIIEERENLHLRRPEAPRETLLLFSSKTPTQLHQYLTRFLDYLQSARYGSFGIHQLNLEDIAFTLRCGRQEMNVRLAILADTPGQLIQQIQRYLKGERGAFFEGVVTRTSTRTKIAAALTRGPEFPWRKLAELWVGGASLADPALFPELGGNRIPLPGYCFPSTLTEGSQEAAVVVGEPTFAADVWQRWSAAFAEIDVLARLLLLARFQAWGSLPRAGERVALETLADQLALAEEHRQLFALMPDMLVRAGALRKQGEHYHVVHTAPVELADLERRKAALIEAHPELETQVKTMWECLANLEDVLSGKLASTSILFANGSMKRVEGFYRGNPVVDYFNQLVGWQLVSGIEARRSQLQPGEKVAILEIGAGTGGTSATLLPTIHPYGAQLSYVYSDISAGFTQLGKQTFAQDYAFLDFKVLNIEKDIALQGFQEQAFDLIVAANVLHATSDLRRTLRHARSLLKPDGRLILNEVTRAQDFISLTFGLLKGWWLFKDPTLRAAGGPLLDAALWRKFLREEGFADVQAYGQTAPDGSDSGYVILVASQAPAAPARTEAPAAALPSQAELVQTLRQTLAHALMIDAQHFDLDAPYSEFGLDSFTSYQVVTELNQRLQLQLRSTDLFNYPSINRLCQHIVAETQKRAAPTASAPAIAPTVAPASPSASAPSRPPAAATAQAGIAVIGMSVRFPMADNLAAFWANLVNGRDCVGEVPAGRWSEAGHLGGFLSEIDHFDPLFFKISPEEARWMDPQQRLFLQEAWRAFEDAGYAPESLEERRCGVFVGCRESDYLRPFAHLGHSRYQGIGSSTAILSARIAYFLNLKGPSLSLDTACSSALVAVALACESIAAGTCELALAGGVALSTTPENHRILGMMGMLSPTARCMTFDDRADGFVPGEAVAVVLLKPLDQALADHDHIYGVIKGYGMNQDGKTHGITASSSPSQAALQRAVYQRFGIDPDSIGYVEAHGTGTALGDPIEVDALSDSFRTWTQRQQFCALGSVKTNIGHALAAAGIAGLVKVLLCLERRQLVPSLHFETQNQHFQLAQTPFYVNTEYKPWENPPGLPLRAAVSSFGFSGTNAHCVVEEAPPRALVPERETRDQLIALSARTRVDLQAKLRELAAWLRAAGDQHRLRDLAATLLLGRSHFEFRLGFVAANSQELLAQVEHWAALDPDALPARKAELGAALRQFGGRLVRELAQPQAAELRESLLSLADLYQQGYDLDWAGLFPEGFQRVAMPTYPFVGQRIWLAPTAASAPVPSAAPFQPAPLPERPPALRDFQRAYARIPEFCLRLLLYSFQRMGAFTGADEALSLTNLTGRMGIHPRHTRLLHAFLDQLQAAGLLRAEGERFVGTAALQRLVAQWPDHQIPDLTRQWAADYPQIKAFLELLWACVQRYPEVLTGRLAATEVMYPDASFALVKGIYRENATADFYNLILVENVVKLLAERLPALAPGQKLRILEIGAGTGGTTLPLLARIRSFGERLLYVYSDITAGFVQHGRRSFGADHPFMRFEVLDIEKPPATQALSCDAFELVIATNVLHATRDLSRTLSHVRQLLAPGGVLLLNEVTDVQLYATMTFGLLDGWWLYEDQRLRHSPLLDAPAWVQLLRQNGFVVAAPQGLEDEALKGPGQHVLIAQTALDGQPLPAPAEAAPTVSAPVQTPPATDAGAREMLVLEQVTQTICYVLGIQDRELVMEKSFSDYGLDSISGMDLIDQLKQRFGIDLRMTALFDYPSVPTLAKFIAAEHGTAFLHQLMPVTPAAPVAFAADTVAAQAALLPASEEIALIGMSGRFPGSPDLRAFWRLLAAGQSALTAPPPGRWSESELPPTYKAGFLAAIDQFDPLFFNWSGAEAEQADPQQRIFLEECYAALEDAGYPPHQLAERKVGVFAGVGMSDYLMHMRESGYLGEAQAFWGNSPAVVPARIAYFLDLKGPTLAVDTSCSSSLVAVHLAKESLLRGESELALAGGVYLCTTPHFHVMANRAGMLSPDGQCRSFDQGANGFAFGEGAGVVVLKPLAAALRDRDPIHAVLKGSAVNQDGKTNGITAPSSRSQAELEVSVYERAGIHPESIGYVEAHGTGTSLGDPVEVEALTQAFRRFTAKKHFCYLGSVKTNIGHASLAAGMASIIKVALAFRHQQIPASLNFSEANRYIDFANSPFVVNTTLRPWPRQDQPRRAALSGFGLSGTNAHLVLEEPPARLVAATTPGPVLICLSARSAWSLRQKCQDLVAYLEAEGRDQRLLDIAYTLHLGRKHFPLRLALVVADHAALIQALRAAEPAPRSASRLQDSAALMRSVRDGQLAHGQQVAALNALGEAYRQGQDPDWQLLYPAHTCCRISLPGYPFERARYWFQATPQPVRQQAMPAPRPAAEGTFWQPQWREVRPTRTAPGPVRGSLLVLGEPGLDRSFWTASPVVLVCAGDRYECLPGREPSYRIRAQVEEDYLRLFEDLAQRELVPSHILHAWSPTGYSLDRLQHHLDLGFYALFHLVRAALRQRSGENLQLIYAHETETSRAQALNRAISGFARSLHQEQPQLVARCVEVPSLAQLAAVADEFHQDPAEVEVRYLTGPTGALIRQVRSWQALDLPAPTPQAFALRQQGVYLLTGASGGLGRVFARYLQRQATSQQCPITLVLSGSRPADPELVALIQALQARHCQAAYVQADLSRVDDVQRLVASARAKGQLAGVFHLAGRNRDSRILNKTRAEVADVFAAKVTGTLLLEAALAGEALDCFALFSSATATIGNIGQCDYAYANSLLNALAEQGFLPGQRGFASNWALWQEGGMRLTEQHLAFTQQTIGLEVLTTAQGLQAFESIFQARLPACMFLSGNAAKIRAFIQQQFQSSAKPAPEPHAADCCCDPVEHRQTSPALAPQSAQAQRQAVASVLTRMVADVTRLPLQAISLDDPLDAYGLDSIMVTILNEKLRDRFGNLPATLLYQYPNLGELSDYLRAHAPETAPAVPAAAEVAPVAPASAQRSTVQHIYEEAERIGWPAAAAQVGAADLQADLRQLVAEVLRVPVAEIDLREPLDGLGLDSIVITILNEKLSERLGPVPPTLLFQCATLGDFASELAKCSQTAAAPAADTVSAATRAIYREAETIGLPRAQAEAAPVVARAPSPARLDSAPLAPRSAPYVSVPEPPAQNASAGPPVAPTAQGAIAIAIIGLHGIYPGAETLDRFWENLCAGHDAVGEIPADRWDVAAYYDPDRKQSAQGKMYCKWGGFVDHVDGFDPFFFNIAPREAKLIDPTERFFLQSAWSTLEDAGYTQKRLRETCQMRVGVFAGISNNAYSLWGPGEWANGNMATPCSGLWSIANRVSYFMNLQGPSFPVDTACSSSLSAIHQACMSIRNGECQMALAGGSSFFLHPYQYVAMCQDQMLSPVGRCHSFGEAADGLVPGEGVGTLLLKPLAQAESDRDQIYAVVKGSAVNHGGRSNGYSVPNPKAHAELIKLALEQARIQPNTISYVEAHGTGTALGDPIEVEGLCQAWSSAPFAKQSCALGSVKSNIGHLLAAAGISSVTKVLLQMKHRTLVPTLHAARPNPQIPFAETPFRLQLELAPWTPPAGLPRRAGVSSFGAGGANAHLILEEYPARPAQPGDSGPQLLLLSARNRDQLADYARRWLSFLAGEGRALALADIAYTLQVGREEMSDRLRCWSRATGKRPRCSPRS